MTRSKYTGFTLFTALTLLFATIRTGRAQVTTVQDLGAIPASQAYSGLGWNVDTDKEWNFKSAAAAGAQHVRFQCGWQAVESQAPAPDNTNGPVKYSLPADCRNALAWSKKYSLRPTIVAAYGPPYREFVRFTVPTGAPAGALSMNIQFASSSGGSTFANIKPLYDLFVRYDNASLSARHAPAGTLITGVALTDATHATITFASALIAALPADGTIYVINELLYPPPFTFSPTDPSVVAYANYAQYLATQIAAYGLQGEVELWNEPPFDYDPWDQGEDLYDRYTGFPVANGPTGGFLANWGFVANLQARTDIPAGVTFNWAGPNKSGGLSALGPWMLQNSGVAYKDTNPNVTAESFHPYGNNPEDNMWSEPCLRQVTVSHWSDCNLNIFANPNFTAAEFYNVQQKKLNPAWGIQHTITETGAGAAYGDLPHIARFSLRQYLGFQAANVQVIQFFKLYDASGQLSFFATTPNTDGSYTPLPAYTALAGVISDLAPIHNAPVAPYTEAALSSVSSYSGTYPLDIVHMVGARSGDNANSDYITLWQQSVTQTNPGWGTLASPAPAPVALTVPTGMTVVSVVNLSTRAAVPFTFASQKVSFAVSDDPIGVMVQPLPPAPSTASVKVGSASIPFSTASTSLTAWVSYTGATPPTGNVTFNVDGASSIAAGCQAAAATLTCTASYPTQNLSAGSHVITTAVAADTDYNAASASGSLTVAAPDFMLTSAGPTSATLTTTDAVSFAFDLAPTSGVFPQAIALSVAGLPSDAAYSLTPSSVPNIDGSRAVQLTVRRNAVARNSTPQSGKGVFASVCALLLFCWPGKRRRRLRASWITLMAVLAASVGVASMSGCALATTAGTTPAQTYTVTVTAASGTVQHSNTVSLLF